jgi:hypothetical protein
MAPATMKFDIVSMAPKRGTKFRRTFPARQWSGLHLSECYKGIKKGPNRVLERPVLTPGEWAGVIRERIGVRPDGPPAKAGGLRRRYAGPPPPPFLCETPENPGVYAFGGWGLSTLCPHCVHGAARFLPPPKH